MLTISISENGVFTINVDEVNDGSLDKNNEIWEFGVSPFTFQKSDAAWIFHS